MRSIAFLIGLMLCTLTNAQSKPNVKPIDLNGTYTFKGKTYKSEGKVYGYSGEIRVKMIAKSKIAISFLIISDRSNVGSFVDTLVINGNEAVYKTNCDSNCKVVFRFSGQSITVRHEAKDGDYNFSCCFGHGVVAHGLFKKRTSSIPIIKDQLEE